jgi:hypothetical protein
MSVAPPTPGVPSAASDLVIELEGGRSWRRRRAVEGAFRFGTWGATLECDAVLAEPLRLSLGQLQLGAVERGSARVSGTAGRFPVLRRLGPNAVVPRSEGIEGWLWTSTGGSGLTSLGDDDEAPNAALLFTKPLTSEQVGRAFRPDFLEALAERSPLGEPTVLGLLFRAAEVSRAENVFRRFNLLRDVTDREVPPTLRRSLPTDRPADQRIESAERAHATSVAPPGLG